MLKTVEKRVLWKGSGTYKLIVLPRIILPHRVGGGYVTAKLYDDRADKHSPVLKAPRKYEELFVRLISEGVGFVKNPVFSFDVVEKYVTPTFANGWYEGIVRDGNYYLYLPKILEVPRVLDGYIVIGLERYKSTNYTSGGSSTYYEGELVYRFDIDSSSRTGCKWNKFPFMVFKEFKKVEVIYVHGKKRRIEERLYRYIEGGQVDGEKV